MASGDAPGLQNRRAASFGVAGGFDSHSLPPFVLSDLHDHWRILKVRTRRCNHLAVIKT
jgi:hypothetical protein